MTTFQIFFLCTTLCLFALLVAYGLYRAGCWVWRKCFHDPEDDYEL